MGKLKLGKIVLSVFLVCMIPSVWRFAMSYQVVLGIEQVGIRSDTFARLSDFGFSESILPTQPTTTERTNLSAILGVLPGNHSELANELKRFSGDSDIQMLRMVFLWANPWSLLICLCYSMGIAACVCIVSVTASKRTLVTVLVALPTLVTLEFAVAVVMGEPLHSTGLGLSSVLRAPLDAFECILRFSITGPGTISINPPPPMVFQWVGVGMTLLWWFGAGVLGRLQGGQAPPTTSSTPVKGCN